MFRRLFQAACAVGLLTAGAAAQHVSYEKYTLDNGLTVILHEDHSLPVVSTNIWYYVGSKDERARRSGFAHLFEHLMFMGTDRVPTGEFDNIMEAGGGWNNASTSEDRTNYFDTGPSELLPTLLWLEADRMESLGKSMTQDKLDKQRAVVLNERRQSYENRPYGKADLKVYELMFPKGHPYHIPVIGTHEDLEAATVKDVKDFFATYYVPSNASLVVAGDFDPATVKPMIKRLFDTIPRGCDVVHPKPEPVQLAGVTRVTETDDVQFARTTMVYHSPAHFADGDASMDLAAAVLSDGISSRLYQKLIYENDLAVDVSAYQSSMLLGSLFYIEATAKPGVSLDKVEAAIDDVVSEFIRTGPTKEELERQKSQIEFRTLSRLQSLLSKADMLNQYQFFFGEPDSFKRDLDRYRDATTEKVRQWAANVLTPDHRLVMRVIPEIKAPETNPLDAQPKVASAPPFSPLEPTTFTLGNGVKVYYWHRVELPLTYVTMMFPLGAAIDPPAKSGLSDLTASMLDQGAGDLSAIAFSNALDQLGASFNARASQEETTVSLRTLSRNFDQAMQLYADAILHPSFDAKEWKRVHDLHLEGLKQRLDRPTYVASTVAMKVYFGKDNPYSRPVGGTVTSAENVSLDDVKQLHQEVYRPSEAVLFVAGDLPQSKVRTVLEHTFGNWKDPSGVAPPAAPTFAAVKPTGRKVYIVDRPDAVQTVVRFMMPGAKFNDPRRIQLDLFNTILGGSFTSRLNHNLREEHGYTYGARSRFVMNPSAGYMSASSSVRANVTGASLHEFLKEFADIRTGDITETEATKTRATQRMRTMTTFQGLGGIIAAGVELVRNGKPFSQLGDDLNAMSRVTDTDLNRMAYEAVPVDKSVLVLVGDKKTILEQVKDLDLPKPIELTTSGDPK